MKRKVIILSMIAGIFILGLCVKSAGGSRNIPVSENAALEESVVSEEADGQSEPEKREAEENEEAQPEEVQAEQEPEEAAVPEVVTFKKPIVKLNGEVGELRYDWNYSSIRVDADTLLLVSGCYFPEENLDQKIFFLARAPFYFPREVFRQDIKNGGDQQPCRIVRPHPVDGGYVYEMDEMLYFLDENFQETFPLFDFYELMGDACSFSIDTFGTCDVTADIAKMLACTNEGLYEYDLENGGRRLLEPSEFEPHAYVRDENDCECGFREYRFFGPVKVEYAPDGQSYAYLTGTEEADWGDIRGVVLRSGEGETLYQKESDNIDFEWVESEDTIYFAAFYTEEDEDGIADAAWLIDRVNVNTGEVVTFEVPKKIYSGEEPCGIVGFLDADTLLYGNYWWDDDKSVFKIYRLSSGERQDYEIAGDVDWETMMIDMGGYQTIPVRYPK